MGCSMSKQAAAEASEPRVAESVEEGCPPPQEDTNPTEKGVVISDDGNGPKAQIDRNGSSPKKPGVSGPSRKVRDAYKLGKTLGKGGFSVVKMATHLETGEQYACKIMVLPPPVARDGSSNASTREDIFKEIEILMTCKHDNVLTLYEYFEEGNKVYLITELLFGGELLDAVLTRGSYSEADARMCFLQLVKGIKYLHSLGIAHRDLKLENLLLVSPDDITRIKIVDFGLAKASAEKQMMETVCGTPQYVAPEVIQGTPGLKYGPTVDMWSAGVVLFILLGGYPPFFHENDPQLFRLIRRGRFSFDDPIWDRISEPAKDLIRKLLVVDPEKRLTAAETLKHPWLSIVSAQLSHTNLMAARHNMQLNMRRRFQGAVGSVIAMNRANAPLSDPPNAMAGGSTDAIPEAEEEQEQEQKEVVRGGRDR